MKQHTKRKRATFIFGAGASIDFGACSTAALTTYIETYVLADEYARHVGADAAWGQLRHRVNAFYDGKACANFEHIYHIAHELMQFDPISERYTMESRPLMQAIAMADLRFGEFTLRVLCRKIIQGAHLAMSTASAAPKMEITKLRRFIDVVGGTHLPRLYTTNYDSFLLQACSEFYTGFGQEVATGIRAFDRDRFFTKADAPSLSHLHGSIHFGFPHRVGRIGELFWFDDPKDAHEVADFGGASSQQSRLDGSSLELTGLLTGLDKLSRLQLKPMSYYYAQLPQDLMTSDIIFLVGCGLGDLHLLSWLRQARSKSNPPTLIVIDYWQPDYLHHVRHNLSSIKEIRMVHDLGVSLFGFNHGVYTTEGWAICKTSNAAIWHNGFGEFLNTPDALPYALSHLKDHHDT